MQLRSEKELEDEIGNSCTKKLSTLLLPRILISACQVNGFMCDRPNLGGNLISSWSVSRGQIIFPDFIGGPSIRYWLVTTQSRAIGELRRSPHIYSPAL